MRSIVVLISLLSGLLLFTSCDPITTWAWEVQNQSSRDITVEVTSEYDIDTINIAAGQRAVVFEYADMGRSDDPLYMAAQIEDILVYAATDTAQRDFEDIQFWGTDTETLGKISKSFRHQIYITVEDAHF